jgi:hypothetical protein
MSVDLDFRYAPPFHHIFGSPIKICFAHILILYRINVFEQRLNPQAPFDRPHSYHDRGAVGPRPKPSFIGEKNYGEDLAQVLRKGCSESR